MTTATTFPTAILEASPAVTPVPWKFGDFRVTAFPTDTASALQANDHDAAWIAKVRAGDEEAAGALVRRLYPTVIRLVRSRLPRRASEEDLAQTVYAKIFSKLDQFSGSVPLEHWVSRIVVNTCFNQLRHELVRPELRMSDLNADEERVLQQLTSTETDLPHSSSHAARELVEKLLDRLKPDERLVITLLHLEEKTLHEISQLTGWSVTLVKVRAFRARQKMRKLWRTLFDGVRE